LYGRVRRIWNAAGCNPTKFSDFCKIYVDAQEKERNDNVIWATAQPAVLYFKGTFSFTGTWL